VVIGRARCWLSTTSGFGGSSVTTCVPSGDFGELLRRGPVISPEGVDPEAWRAELRAGAASHGSA
jgi:hypothetical protein